MNNKNNSNDHTNDNARGFIWNPPGSDVTEEIFDGGGTPGDIDSSLNDSERNSAVEISVGTAVSGYISEPGAEQLFKFTAPTQSIYSIFTTGDLDTIGYLYDSNGDLIISGDDLDPTSNNNFHLTRTLAADSTNYIKVKLHNNATGDYILKVVIGTSEHSSTSPHIYHAILSEDNNEYTFTCEYAQCNESFTVPKDQVVGSYVTSSTDPRLGNSQTPLAYGIDVSSYTGDISLEDWETIANTQIDGHTITFAILRIGRERKSEIVGVLNRVKDEYFDSNYERAKAAGLQVGCYYCTESWSPQNALADAEQVIEWIGDKQFEYPVFFDIESNGIKNNVPDNITRTEICLAFMNKMREAGFFTGFYTNDDWIKTKLNSNTLFPEYDFWYARYKIDNTAIPNFWGENDESNWAGPGRKFGMWQFAENKKISPNVAARGDLNVAYKNYPLIIKALHLNNFN